LFIAEQIKQDDEYEKEIDKKAIVKKQWIFAIIKKLRPKG
jgi:hypothetical protein